jgi:hypothetical protein
MTDKAIIIIKRIGNWYLMEHGTYIRVYGAMKSPHLLPRFVPDRLVLQEVAYQTVIHRVSGILYRDKKGYGLHSHYTLALIIFQTLNKPRRK